MTILVTGGAGFIGSAVVLRLLAEGERVVVVDKLTYAANPLTVSDLAGHAGCRLVQADIAESQAMVAALADCRPSAIIHLAAESHVDRSIDAPGDFVRTNVQGTFTLLEAAQRHYEGLTGAERDAFRFVHVSTDEVFGSLGPEGAFAETSPYRPNSPYSASKAASDHLAWAWHATYGLPVAITNCSNNYGPRQFPEKLIPLLIRNALAGRPLPVYGDGLNVRDWLFVDDHAQALIDIARRALPGSRYVIGGAAEVPNIDIVRAVCAILDELHPIGAPHARLITYVADRPGHDRRYATDFSHLAAELGWRPCETLASGLHRTVRWYLDNPDWCAACGADASTRRGLGVRHDG